LEATILKANRAKKKTYEQLAAINQMYNRSVMQVFQEFFQQPNTAFCALHPKLHFPEYIKPEPYICISSSIFIISQNKKRKKNQHLLLRSVI
jgi:hypothetical protein